MAKKPSPAERIETTTAQYVEVRASPGSGKTHALVQRLRHLRSVEKVPASKILVLSFSKAAVATLQQRMQSPDLATTDTDLSDVLVQTTHGYAYGVVRSRTQFLGVVDDATELLGMVILNVLFRASTGKIWTNEPQKTIQSRMKKLEQLAEPLNLKRIINLFNVDRSTNNKLSTTIRRAQFEELVPHLKALNYILVEYAQAKKKQRLVDFADMLDEAQKILVDNPAAVPFTHILVDEFQDCSKAQTLFLAQLATLPLPKSGRERGNISGSRSIMVFGDRKQAIFSFAGSSYTPLSTVLAGVVQLTLPDSWRLTEETAALASAVAQLPPDQAIRTKRSGTQPMLLVDKTLAAQTKRIVSDIKSLIASGVDRQKIVVLARTKASLVGVEALLLAQNTETQRQGQQRLKVHPRRVLRLVRLVEHGASGQAIDSARVRRTLTKLTDVTDGGWNKAAADLRRAVKVQSLDGRYKLCAATYLRLLGGVRRNAELRANVNRWQPFCRGYKSAKEVRDAIVAQDSAAVVTSTIHGAKGGEWDHVFIVGATEGLLPIHFVRDQRMLAEERNLLYVAITRASESVRLYHAPTHITRTGDLATDVSSFLDDPAVRKTLNFEP